MKKRVTLILTLFFCVFSFSQDLIIKSGPKGLYLEHKVAPKEGLFPLGRMYNVHPRHIANFNGIDFNKGLSIGQQINIPLSDTNFKTTVNQGIPVYYKPTGKESLANIGVKNKVQINKLREWNDLNADNVEAGTKLIVGFLITNEMKDRGEISIQSKVPKDIVPPVEESVSNVKKQAISEKKGPPAEVKKDTVAVEESVSNVKKQAISEKKEPPAEVKKDTVVVEESVSNVKKQAISEKKEPPAEVKKDTVVVEESVSNVKKQEAAEKKLPVAEVKNEVTENKKTESAIIKPSETINDDGTGYFKNNFYQQLKTSPLTREQTVTSSIFKTTSGWQDGKYYLLINGVEPGTIVKITNPSNSKTVFAKVLYAMDKIRENQGVDIRISDAAAATLSVTETDKFILKVNY